MLSEVQIVTGGRSLRAMRPGSISPGAYAHHTLGGRNHAGIAGPQGFPEIACVSEGCAGTMRLDWRGHGNTGRLLRRIVCPECGLSVGLRRAAKRGGQGPYGPWLPDSHARRHGHGIELSAGQMQLLVHRVHLAAIAQASPLRRAADQVLSRIPADLLELRALAMIDWDESDLGSGPWDANCPHCDGKATGLTCRLCLGFRFIPLRLANWYKRAIAGLHGRSDADCNADPLEHAEVT